MFLLCGLALWYQAPELEWTPDATKHMNYLVVVIFILGGFLLGEYLAPTSGHLFGWVGAVAGWLLGGPFYDLVTSRRDQLGSNAGTIIGLLVGLAVAVLIGALWVSQLGSELPSGAYPRIVLAVMFLGPPILAGLAAGSLIGWIVKRTIDAIARKRR